MHRKYALLLFLAMVCTGINAQLSNYYFSATSGAYTPIAGTAATLTFNKDDGCSGLLNIGFTFTYNGTDFTQLDACANGFVQLGVAIDQGRGSTTLTNLSSSYYRNVLAPLWDDLYLSGNIRYETSGAAPNRVFTVQWGQAKWDYSSSGPVIEFQLKLYETSNRIEFIYNQLAAPVEDGQALIGINTSGSGSGSFIVLTNSGPNPGLNSDASAYYYINKKPATGQVYAFFIPMPCTGTPDAGTTQTTNDPVCSGSNFKLSVTGSTLAKNITYQWQSSADGATWQNIAGATDTNYTAQQTANTHYRRAITCGGNTAYSAPVLVTTGTLPVTFATLPFTENFEATWISNCGLRELPSTHFVNSVATGNRSWRREDDVAAGEWTSGSFDTWIGGSASHAARFHVRDEFSAPVHTTGDLDLYLDCSPAGTKELRFRHIQTLGATALSVWYSTDNGAHFLSLGDVLGWNQWNDQHFIIPSNSSTTIIRFRGQGAGYTSASDIGIDDIQVLVVTCNFPTGLAVSNLEQTTATVSWNGEPGAEYEYIVNTASQVDPPADGRQITTDHQINITGLNPANDYFLHVRRRCGDQNYSSWSSLAFTPSTDCGIATAVTCGLPYTFTIADGYGRYNLWLTDRENNCGGGGGYGKEQLVRFVPQVTGTYSLKITATGAGYAVTYYIKDAAQGCAPSGWTCLGNSASPATLSMGTLTAGKEYFLLVDLATIVNGHTETIEIVCPAASPDCVAGAITPAGPVALCDGNNRLEVTGGTAWQWFRNGTPIAGATANSYTATQPGKYTVAITNGACTRTASNAVIVTPAAIPPPVVTVTGNTSFCMGGSVQLSTATVAGSTYQWLKNEVEINGATSETYTAATAGDYSVKVTQADGCYAISTVITVTVTITPGKPTVTYIGSPDICQGRTLVLTSSALSGNQWYKDGVAISAATGRTLDITAPTGAVAGAYTVIAAINGCASPASEPVNVTVTNLPSIPTITPSGAVTLCEGETRLLTSSAASGNQWYKDDILINGATDITYPAGAAGEYKVMTSVNSCSTSLSSAVKITLKAASPTPSLTAQTATTFCEGDSVKLLASIAGSQHWYRDGTDIAFGTPTSYTVKVAGVYTVRNNENGCFSAHSNAITITTIPKPPVPTFTVAFNIFTSSAATGNQWYKDGVLIAGATAQTYTATANGVYTVQVTANGCSSAVSNGFNFTTTAIVDPVIWNNTVQVYPNPVYGDLFIKNGNARKLTFRLTDASGRILYTGELHASQEVLPIKKLANGIYHLLITDVLKNESILKVILKQ